MGGKRRSPVTLLSGGGNKTLGLLSSATSNRMINELAERSLKGALEVFEQVITGSTQFVFLGGEMITVNW